MPINLPLEQMLAIHTAEKGRRFSFMPKDGGEFEVEATNIITGERVWKETHHNLLTKHFRDMIGRSFSPSVYLFVSNDEKPMNVRKDHVRATYFNVMSNAVSSKTINVPSRTWTYTGTIPVPTAGHVRPFRTVGIASLQEQSYAANCRSVWTIIAATLLSEMRTQDELTVISINYRLAWEEGHNV